MSRRAENLRRKRQRKIMLIRKYIRFTFCCVLIVVLAFAINYLKKNMNNISESGNSGGNDVKKIKESKEESANRLSDMQLRQFLPTADEMRRYKGLKSN